MSETATVPEIGCDYCRSNVGIFDLTRQCCRARLRLRERRVRGPLADKALERVFRGLPVKDETK